MVDLGRLEVGRDEDVGRQPDRGGGRRGRSGQVAGRGAGEGLDPEVDGPRGGHRNGPILERQRRIAGVVLDEQAVQPERRRKPVGCQQRRRADGQPAGRWRIDGQQLEVAPDPGRTRRDRRTGEGRAGHRVVVLELERAEAGGADVGQPDRLGRAAVATAHAEHAPGSCRPAAGEGARWPWLVSGGWGAPRDRGYGTTVCGRKGVSEGEFPYRAGGPARTWHLADLVGRLSWLHRAGPSANS